MQPPGLFLELAVQLGKRDLGQRGGQEPNSHPSRVSDVLCREERTRRIDHLSSNPSISPFWHGLCETAFKGLRSGCKRFSG